MQKKVLLLFLSIVILVALKMSLGAINITAGHIYKGNLISEKDTLYWGGIFGSLSGSSLQESQDPFFSFYLSDPLIYEYGFPGANLNDGKHYFGVLPISTQFNISKVKNITFTDLQPYQLYNPVDYPYFYPNYNTLSDNPNLTFCCNYAEIVLAGVPFLAYTITLKQNVKYYLLKYEEGGKFYPLYIVPLSNYNCYDYSSCNYQFMFPKEKTYYFYVLSKEPAIKIEVFIDGVQTKEFDHTSIPYNVTVVVRNLYSNVPIPNRSVAVYEKDGNNLYILPLGTGAYFSKALAISRTNAQGKASFVVVPTKYQSPSTYEIGVAVLEEDGHTFSKSLILNVTAGSIEYIKKNTIEYLQTVKDSTNFMRPIADCLFKYANDEIAVGIEISGPGSVEVIRGIPYVIKLTDASSSYMVLEENNGYLVLSPAHDLNKYNFTHFGKIPYNQEVIITPTLDGGKTFYAKIYNSNDNLLYTYNFTVAEATCDTPSFTISYPSQSLKDCINAIRPVLNSLFFSVN